MFVCHPGDPPTQRSKRARRWHGLRRTPRHCARWECARVGAEPPRSRSGSAVEVSPPLTLTPTPTSAGPGPTDGGRSRRSWLRTRPSTAVS
jgi:hypothetical protein